MFTRDWWPASKRSYFVLIWNLHSLLSSDRVPYLKWYLREVFIQLSLTVSKLCNLQAILFIAVTIVIIILIIDRKPKSLKKYRVNPKRRDWRRKGRGVNLNPPEVFPKMYLPEREDGVLFFVTFNIIIIHTFAEIFIEILQFVQKIWRFSPSIFTAFVEFLDFLTFSCYKETNGVSI